MNKNHIKIPNTEGIISDLIEAFDKFRPHINGHATSIELFLNAVNDIKTLDSNENRIKDHLNEKNFILKDKINVLSNKIKEELKDGYYDFEQDDEVDVKLGKIIELVVDGYNIKL